MDDFESELLDSLEENLSENNFGIIKISHQSVQATVFQTLNPGQITYSFTLISRKLVNITSQLNLNLDNLEILFSLARFTCTHVAQLHIYML